MKMFVFNYKNRTYMNVSYNEHVKTPYCKVVLLAQEVIRDCRLGCLYLASSRNVINL